MLSSVSSFLSIEDARLHFIFVDGICGGIIEECEADA